MAGTTQRIKEGALLPGDPIPENINAYRSAYCSALEYDFSCIDSKTVVLHSNDQEWSCSPCHFAIQQIPYSPAYDFQHDFISSRTSLYVPRLDDPIIGIACAKSTGDCIWLNVRSVSDAFIPSIDGFEGATKRNKPNPQIGEAFLCTVKTTSRSTPIECTCKTVKCLKPWTSKEKILGKLEQGVVVDIPIPLAQCLSSPYCLVLDLLGHELKFEIAVGLNGRLWVKANSPKESLLVINVLLACMGRSESTVRNLIDTFISQSRSF